MPRPQWMTGDSQRHTPGIIFRIFATVEHIKGACFLNHGGTGNGFAFERSFSARFEQWVRVLHPGTGWGC